MAQPALPHALLYITKPRVDPAIAARALTNPRDTVLVVTQQRKPGGTTMGIFIDDIRAVQRQVRTMGLGPNAGNGRTVVIFADAALMTPQAQNALLKLLEEPRPQLHCILATSTPTQLLATVRSRCQVRYAAPTAVPTTADKRIQFMAQGVGEEAERLMNDPRYYQQRLALFEQAKALVSGTSYQRITAIAALASDREQALATIDAGLYILTTQLKARYHPRIASQLTALYQARRAVAQNGHIRLQLLRSVL